MKCKGELRDYMDAYTCGEPALPCGYCESCRKRRVEELRLDIKHLEPKLRELEAKRAELRFVGDYIEDPVLSG